MRTRLTFGVTQTRDPTLTPTTVYGYPSSFRFLEWLVRSRCSSLSLSGLLLLACIQVPRVQYGTSGLQQQPRGLLLETFLKHAHPGVFTNNRYPKVTTGGNVTSA